jgi:hypothetical protein
MPLYIQVGIGEGVSPSAATDLITWSDPEGPPRNFSFSSFFYHEYWFDLFIFFFFKTIPFYFLFIRRSIPLEEHSRAVAIVFWGTFFNFK